MNRLRLFAGVFFVGTVVAVAAPNPAPELPVREVTVFKDGHAFLLHEGRLPVGAGGEIVLDYLPAPVLGTFWPYSGEKDARLVATVAGQRKVASEQTALSLRELIEANVGARVVVTENNDKTYPATIAGVPNRKDDEATAPAERSAASAPPPAGDLVLLRTDAGLKALSLTQIKDVTFTDANGSKQKVARETFRNQLTLRLQGVGATQGRAATVGMAYLQRGIRWIPGYKVTLAAKGAEGRGGTARVQLQGTLLNDITDLSGVTANLVIGVPNFAFQATPDPIGLQDTLAQLSPYFDANSRFGGPMSNALMSQARFSEGFGGGGVYAPGARDNAGNAAAPAVTGAQKNEDLFVFTVKNVSLRKGERMVLPVASYDFTYKDVYTLDVPIIPPREWTQNYSSEQQTELARLLQAPRVLHKVRLCNTSPQPLTTAPALLLRNERLLGQGMMLYTSPGGDADLTLTTAVDVSVKRTESETKRTPNAVEMQGYQYARVDLQGTLTLTNFKKHPVTVEVNRYLLGDVDTAGNNGAVTRINLLEEPDALGDSVSPVRHGWPDWWNRMNAVSRVRWSVTIPAGKSVDLPYAWHYLWR